MMSLKEAFKTRRGKLIIGINISLVLIVSLILSYWVSITQKWPFLETLDFIFTHKRNPGGKPLFYYAGFAVMLFGASSYLFYKKAIKPAIVVAIMGLVVSLMIYSILTREGLIITQ